MSGNTGQQAALVVMVVGMLSMLFIVGSAFLVTVTFESGAIDGAAAQRRAERGNADLDADLASLRGDADFEALVEETRKRTSRL